MKAVIQRVLDANLKVDGKTISDIGQGYVIFLGVKKGDDIQNADYFIKKIPSLRICEDENGKINKSIVDVGGEILLVSDRANELYIYVAEGLKKQGLTVKLGVFGADMKINQTNDGPFTVILEK